MSTAEITAQHIYNTYNLGALPQDVKRHLMILFLNSEISDKTEESYPNSVSEELCSRAQTALEQIKSGEGRPIDELFDEIDTKYPELSTSFSLPTHHF